METLIQNNEKTVNFLDFSKKMGDWRHRAYEDLFLHKEQEKTVYWIGTIPLSEVEKTKDSYPVCFYDGRKRQCDYAQRRDVDGADLGESDVLIFSIPEPLKEEMLRAKEEGKQYHSFFIEETVDSNGRHEVYVLYTEKENVLTFGISSNYPWQHLSYFELQDYANFRFHDEIKRNLILSHGPYNWLK
jgi:hypothetical protein